MCEGPEWSRNNSDLGRKQKSKKKNYYVRDGGKNIARRGSIMCHILVNMEKKCLTRLGKKES